MNSTEGHADFKKDKSGNAEPVMLISTVVGGVTWCDGRKPRRWESWKLLVVGICRRLGELVYVS